MKGKGSDLFFQLFSGNQYSIEHSILNLNVQGFHQTDMYLHERQSDTNLTLETLKENNQLHMDIHTF